MSEALYPPLTVNQKQILRDVKFSGKLTRQQIASKLDIPQQVANQEISSLVIRRALVADTATSDLFSLGKEAKFRMSPAAHEGICDKVCPICGLDPCSKPMGHRGKCSCCDCSAGG